MKSNVHDIFIAAYWCEIYINITTRPCRFDRYGDGIEIIVTNDTLRRIYYLDKDVILVETPLTGGEPSVLCPDRSAGQLYGYHGRRGQLDK